MQETPTGWTIALSVVAFPVGMLALLDKDESQFVISVQQRDRQTTVDVAGTARLGVRRAVHNLAGASE